MNIMINSEEAAKAAKDARLSLGGAVQVCIKKKDGVALGQFITCEGNSQTHTPFRCELDDNEAEFITGPELLNTIVMMADMGDIIQISGNGAESIGITCGGSNIALGLKQEIKLFVVRNDTSTISVKMSVSEFQDTITYGGYCPSKDDSHGLKNVIELRFKFGTDSSDTQKQFLCVQTTDFYKGARMVTEIKDSMQMKDGNPQKAAGEKTYALDCTKVQAMAGMLLGEEVDIFLNEGQAVFINSGRIFIFRAFEKEYPDLSNAFKRREETVEIEVNAADVKRAADLVSVVCNTDEQPIVLIQEKGMLVLTDEKGKSVNRITAKIAGEIGGKFGLKKENLIIGLLKASSEKVRILISGAKSPFFINGDKHEGIYFAAPVLLKKETGNEGKEQEE
jgi:hypothetical protein